MMIGQFTIWNVPCFHIQHMSVKSSLDREESKRTKNSINYPSGCHQRSHTRDKERKIPNSFIYLLKLGKSKHHTTIFFCRLFILY